MSTKITGSGKQLANAADSTESVVCVHQGVKGVKEGQNRGVKAMAFDVAAPTLEKREKIKKCIEDWKGEIVNMCPRLFLAHKKKLRYPYTS